MAKANENNDNVVTNEELEATKVALEKANQEKEELLKQIEELKKANDVHAPKKGSFIVKAPVKNFNGEVAGVQFAYGQAVVQPGWVLEWLKEKGFEAEEVR